VSRRTHAGWPRQKPLRLIADRGYDSDPLRKRLVERGIELIAPHRWNRSKPVTQDGRALRRYRRRWKVERTKFLREHLNILAALETLHCNSTEIFGVPPPSTVRHL